MRNQWLAFVLIGSLLFASGCSSNLSGYDVVMVGFTVVVLVVGGIMELDGRIAEPNAGAEKTLAMDQATRPEPWGCGAGDKKRVPVLYEPSCPDEKGPAAEGAQAEADG